MALANASRVCRESSKVQINTMDKVITDGQKRESKNIELSSDFFVLPHLTVYPIVHRPWTRMVVTNKFWHSLGLLLMLLPYLDVSSTWALALPLVLDVLQHKFVWNGLLKRWRKTPPIPTPTPPSEFEEVKQLANILKMMEQSETLLFDLLDIICEKYDIEDGEDLSHLYTIRLKCRRHENGHLLCVNNFKLLELAESMLRTSLQRMAHLNVDYGEPLLLVQTKLLLQRINRQNDSLPELSMDSLELAGTLEDRAFMTLLKHTSQWDICRIILRDDFGKEDWSKLAEAMNYKKNENLRVAVVEMSREVMLRGSNEDLQTVWEGVKFGNHDPSGTCSCGLLKGWQLLGEPPMKSFISSKMFGKDSGFKAKELIDE